jgi:7tm Chemosensory receptor
MLATIVTLFYKYNQACGMCPISMSQSHQVGKSTVKNLALLFWSLVHIAGVVCLVAVIMSRESFFFVEKQHPTIGKFNDQLKVATILFTHLTILVECLLTKDNYVEMENKMDETNHMLTMIGVDPRELDRQFSARFVRKLLMCLSVCWAVEIKIIVGCQNDIQWTKVWYLTIFSLMVTRSRHMQHTYYIDNLAYRTKVIKKQLKKIVVCSKSKDFFDNERNMEAVIGQLKLIKNIYNTLYETSELVVRSFGYSQLMNFLQNFVQLTCDLYWIYSVLYKNNFVNIWGEFFSLKPPGFLFY